ncbi:uncharacterized protein [Zea mays]|uniref:uncharacterized protein isoform X1 n=1 Tax=Zea mays TaxID=4577 RepID=UPI000C6C7FCE|nr:uncharacterized protein LOC100304028 isoform X1 [Zea mays]|eukprot:XP_023157304.1 uncharacterized protein LOC100304028 isoform X1 [Zea mays]
MAKNRNKKNRAKSGGLAAMDTSEGGPATSTAADVPQPMDTSEGKQPSSATAALGSINKPRRVKASQGRNCTRLEGFVEQAKGLPTFARPCRCYHTGDRVAYRSAGVSETHRRLLGSLAVRDRTSSSCSPGAVFVCVRESCGGHRRVPMGYG